MRLKHLKLHDFMSHEDTSLDLSNVSVCSVVGANGAGKSTLIEAVMWAIFGVARLPNKDLVRSGQKRAFVEITFEMDQHECVIERSFEDGETNVSFLVDGVSVAEGKKNRGEEILRRLRASREILLSSIAITQGQLSSFLQSAPFERRDLIMSMLLLDKFENAYTQAKNAFQSIVATMASAKRTMETLEGQISQIPEPSQLQERIDEARRQESRIDVDIEAVTTKRESFLAQEKESRKRLDWVTMRVSEVNRDAMAQASTFVKEVGDLEASVKKAEDEIAMLPIFQKAVETLEVEIKAVQAIIDEVTGLQVEKRQCDEEIKSLQDRLVVASKAQDACPLCNSQLSPERWQEILGSMKMNLASLVSKTTDLGRSIQSKQTNKTPESVRREIESTRERITKATGRIEARIELLDRLDKAKVRRAEVTAKIQQELDTLTKESSDIQAGLSAEVVVLNGRLNELKVERQTHSDAKLKWSTENRTRDNLTMMIKDTADQLAVKKAAHDETEFVYNALSPTGIRLMIVDHYLPQIELRAQNLLHRMSDGRLEFKMSVVEEGKRKGIELLAGSGTLRPVRALSGGEQTRVSLAVRLALSQILSEMAGCKFDMLLLDEPEFLDEEGISQLIESVGRLKELFPQIFVMSHHPSLRQAFPNMITVEKHAGISTAKVTS